MEERLKKIESQLDALTSYRQAFFRGLLSGVGTAIGASVVAAVIFAFITKLVDYLDVPTEIQKFLIQAGVIR